jgi:hypothetical protein
MNDGELAALLEAEFDLETGFVGQLRERKFVPLAQERFLDLIESIDLGANEQLNRRIVSLLWMLPLILRWRVDDFRSIGRDVTGLERVVDRVEAALMAPKALGAP